MCSLRKQMKGKDEPDLDSDSGVIEQSANGKSDEERDPHLFN